MFYIQPDPNGNHPICLIFIGLKQTTNYYSSRVLEFMWIYPFIPWHAWKKELSITLFSPGSILSCGTCCGWTIPVRVGIQLHLWLGGKCEAITKKKHQIVHQNGDQISRIRIGEPILFIGHFLMIVYDNLAETPKNDPNSPAAWPSPSPSKTSPSVLKIRWFFFSPGLGWRNVGTSYGWLIS